MNMWKFAVAVIALALLLPAVNIGLADSADEFDAVESTSVDYDENYELGNQSVYAYENLLVENGGIELTEGEDYEFIVTESRFGVDGEINWIDTAETTSGDQVDVTYSALNHSQQTKNQQTVLSSAAAWAPYLLLVICSLLAVKLAGGGGF